MPLTIETKQVKPRQEDKTFEVEVYVSYYNHGNPFIFAQISGDGSNPYASKDARLVERYVFKVTHPFINKE